MFKDQVHNLMRMLSPQGGVVATVGTLLMTTGAFVALTAAPTYGGLLGGGKTDFMAAARSEHAIAALPDGGLLITGGISQGVVVGNAEIYDYETGISTPVASAMLRPRAGHTATSLFDGRILIVGGYDELGMVQEAEVYNPETGTFQAAGALSFGRSLHSASIAGSAGRVLIAGGHDGAASLASIEVFHPATDTFSVLSTPLIEARDSHAVVFLGETTLRAREKISVAT